MVKEKVIKRKGNIVMKKVGDVYWVYSLPFKSYLEKFWHLKDADLYYKELLRGELR